MTELGSQAQHLRDQDPEQEEQIKSRRVLIEERFNKVMEPLNERRRQLDKVKRVQQFLRDIDDEKLWISEEMPQATSTDFGNSLLSVKMLQKKNISLKNEIDGHEPYITNVCDVGRSMIEDQHPQSEEFQQRIDELMLMWEELVEAVEARKARLELSEIAQQVSSPP